MSNIKHILLAASSALIAAGEAFASYVDENEHEFVAEAAPVTGTFVAPAAGPTLADKVRDVLTNDDSNYDYRSAKHIAGLVGATENEVAAAARGSRELKVKNSTSGLGTLISLAD